MSRSTIEELQSIQQELNTAEGLLDNLVRYTLIAGQQNNELALMGCSLEVLRDYIASRTERLDRALCKC